MAEPKKLTPSQQRALQIIKLASEQQDDRDKVRNGILWVIQMIKANDDKAKIVEYLQDLSAL